MNPNPQATEETPMNPNPNAAPHPDVAAYLNLPEHVFPDANVQLDPRPETSDAETRAAAEKAAVLSFTELERLTAGWTREQVRLLDILAAYGGSWFDVRGFHPSEAEPAAAAGEQQ